MRVVAAVVMLLAFVTVACSAPILVTQIGKPPLASSTYYVSTTGTVNNNGLTPATAVDSVDTVINLKRYVLHRGELVIKMLPGNYKGFCLGGGDFGTANHDGSYYTKVVVESTTANPADVIFDADANAGYAVIEVLEGMSLVLRNVTVRADGLIGLDVEGQSIVIFDGDVNIEDPNSAGYPMVLAESAAVLDWWGGTVTFRFGATSNGVLMYDGATANFSTVVAIGDPATRSDKGFMLWGADMTLNSLTASNLDYIAELTYNSTWNGNSLTATNVEFGLDADSGSCYEFWGNVAFTGIGSPNGVGLLCEDNCVLVVHGNYSADQMGTGAWAPTGSLIHVEGTTTISNCGRGVWVSDGGRFVCPTINYVAVSQNVFAPEGSINSTAYMPNLQSPADPAGPELSIRSSDGTTQAYILTTGPYLPNGATFGGALAATGAAGTRKLLDLSSVTGLGSGNYLLYGGTTNYWRGDGRMLLSNSMARAGGAGFLTLSQSSGTPDADSGWYDNNDKTISYRLDNSDRFKILNTGIVSSVPYYRSGGASFLTLSQSSGSPDADSGWYDLNTKAMEYRIDNTPITSILSTGISASVPRYKTGGAGFLTLSQSAGSPDSDSGWYDVNDKSMNYRIDNADIFKMGSTGITSPLGTNLGTATAADTGTIKSVFNWDAGARTFIGVSTATGTPDSSDYFLNFNASNYWRGDGLLDATTIYQNGAPISGSFVTIATPQTVSAAKGWTSTQTMRELRAEAVTGLSIRDSGGTTQVFIGSRPQFPNGVNAAGLWNTQAVPIQWVSVNPAGVPNFILGASMAGTSLATGISSCADTDLTTVADGHTLKYNAGDGKWYPVVGGGGATALASLTDVDVSTATNEQVLTYSGGTWYPRTVNEYGGYDQILFVDGNTSLPTLRQAGTAERPYKTIQQALTSIGQPTNATEYKQNCIVVIAPTTYTENLTVPHRAITLKGHGVKIVGNITREIGDEYEYGTSSSVWRGTLTLMGYDDGRDNHQASRQGIWVTGNYRCKVAAGKTGFTTHDTFFRCVRIDGTTTADDGVVNGGATSVGTEVLYIDGSQFNGTVEGRGFYCQRWNNAMLNAATVIVGTLGLLTHCQFEDGDVWSGFTPMTVTVNSGYTDPPNHEAFTFQDCTFRQVTLNTTAASKSLRIDASSLYWWKSGVTLGTNPPTVTLVETFVPDAAASVTYYVATTGVANNSGLSIGKAKRQVSQVLEAVPASFRGVVNIECADGTYAGFALNDALRQGSANTTSPEHAEYQVIVYSASADPTLVTFVVKPTYGASPPDAVVSVSGAGSLKLFNVTIDCNQQSTEAGFSVGPRARGCLETVTIKDVGSMGWGVYCWGGHVRLSGTMVIDANVSEPNTGWGILARSDGYVYADCDMTMTRLGRFIELADHARVNWTSGSFSGTGTVGTRSDYGFFFSSASQAHFYCGPTLSEVETGIYLIDQSKLSVDCDMTVTSTGEGTLGIGVYGMSSLKVNVGSSLVPVVTVGNFSNGVQVWGHGRIVGESPTGLVVNDCSNYGIHVLNFGTVDMGGTTPSFSGNLQNIEFENGQLDWETKHVAQSLRSVSWSTTTTIYRGTPSVIFVDVSGGSIVLSFEMVPDALYKLKMTTDPGANTVTLQGESGNIDGAATNTTALQAQYDACEVYCDGTDLWIW